MKCMGNVLIYYLPSVFLIPVRTHRYFVVMMELSFGNFHHGLPSFHGIEIRKFPRENSWKSAQINYTCINIYHYI